MPATPRNTRLRLRRPPALAFLAGLGLALGMAPSAHAHNCATALQRLTNATHCLEHAFKPVGSCVNNPKACAEEAAAKLGSSMNATILVKAKEWQDVNSRYVTPMVTLWVKLTVEKQENLQELFNGLKDRDLSKTQRKLLEVLQYLKGAYGPEFRAALLELQKIDGTKRGSLTLTFSGGGGTIAEGAVGVGAAIDLDYLLTLILTAGSSTEAFRDQQAVDPIISYFVQGSGSLGIQTGYSVTLLVGYSPGEAKDAVGPSIFAGVEGAYEKYGFAAEVSYTVIGLDQAPVFDGVAMGPAAGVHAKAGAVGVMYTDIFGVSCMNWEFMRGAFLPERFLVEQGLIAQKTSTGCQPAVPGEKIVLRSNANKCFAKKEPGNTNNGNPIHLWDNYGCDIWYYESKTGLIRVGANTNQCVHKKDSDWTNGKITHLWTCDANNPNAVWVYDHGTGLVKSRINGGKCLHKKDSGSNNGNVIHVWDCGAPRENNQWWVKAVWY